ncbi:MAG: HlyC/CorC family transporter [Magnetococcales bacterium]|nr:HlyC/CorC family transporter [Magnetococcales bacterium]MBF0116280.1 HlyC/CorC family transporter [Magnetococcales bacterium]
MEPSFWADPINIFLLVLFAGLLGCSAFFSGTEVAMFSLNQIQLQQMAKEKHPRLALIRRLLSDPRNLIATILIGNELVNVAASNISATLLIKFLGGEDKWWVNIFIMLPILLLVGEITPKTIAVRNNIAFAGIVAPIIASFMTFITPLRRVVRWVANIFITMIVGPQTEKQQTVTEEMVRSLTEQATQDGVLDETEREYIHNIFVFGNSRVQDIMVPRARIIFLPKQSTWQDAIAAFQQTGLTRIPVYEGHRDDILGILHVRDMIKVGPELAKSPQGWMSLLRKPYFVVGNRLVSDLFQTFRERNLSHAMVVDEFGGLIGLVTMDHLLGTIFGDLHSPPTNVLPAAASPQTADGCYLLDGILSLTGFNQLTGSNIDIPDVQVETLAGAILYHLGELPAQGQKVIFSGWEFHASEVENNRITKVRACRLSTVTYGKQPELPPATTSVPLIASQAEPLSNAQTTENKEL